VLRAIEDNLLGEIMATAHALVSSEFFDKLISHPKTEEAYKWNSPHITRAKNQQK